jgi:hypothetical protein
MGSGSEGGATGRLADEASTAGVFSSAGGESSALVATGTRRTPMKIAANIRKWRL